MRYGSTEDTYLVGQFLTGRTVTIQILNPANDTLLAVRTNECMESSVIPGIYIWSTENIEAVLDSLTTLVYVMTSQEDGRTFIGKVVYGGLINELKEVGNIETTLTQVAKDVTYVKLVQ